MTAEIWISFSALIVAILSVAISWYFGRKDHERRRKQGTIEYFENMTSKLFDTQALFNDKFSATEINVLEIENHPDLLKAATEVLSAFERLSVGVNTGVFDFDILNRMAGSYLIFIFSQFAPYVHKIRKDASRQKSYIEFERLVDRIKKIK